LADLSYSLVLRAANLQKSSPKISKRLWKLYDRLVNFGEAVAAKKGK
jgi:DNA anti-recombination protein RmuC